MRVSDPLIPILKAHDQEFPPKDAIKYRNYLIAIATPTGNPEFNFIFTESGTSPYKPKNPMIEGKF